MKVLLLGSGGREHAFAWKIAQSPHCKELYIAPGNSGTKYAGTNVDIKTTDFEKIAAFVVDKGIDTVVVGPEDALVKGIYDFFQKSPKLKKVNLIGPSMEGAKLEGSKSFAKQFMVKHKVPTAGYLEVTAKNIEAAKKHIDDMKTPIVLKADGLAAGKGVLILDTKKEAKKALEQMLIGKQFGEASSKVVIEEFLKGIEFSVFVLTDGNSYKILPVAKDYKRIGEGDTGLNTGGMGAVTPLPFVTPELMKKVEEKIIIPTVNGLKTDKIVYKGFIYIGLMLVGNEPYVIEYNVRMGDPETQVVLPCIKSDLLELFKAVGKGTLAKAELKIKKKACAAIVLASEGYPGEFAKGKTILGADDIEDSFVFHSGTRMLRGDLLTNGGRVITVASVGESLADAVKTSMITAKSIHFEGKYFRKDIGQDVMTKKTVKLLKKLNKAVVEE